MIDFHLLQTRRDIGYQAFVGAMQFAGRYRFGKHFYPVSGELDSDDRSEETACAIELDGMNEVKFRVRNLEWEPDSSFWLPTSTDRFYPDLVAQLNHGRVLVVEYKGGHLFGSPDSVEKNDIGKVWAAASGGRCVLMMAKVAAALGMPVGAQLRHHT